MRRAVLAASAVCGASLWLDDNSTCPYGVTVQVKAGQSGFRNYWLELDDSGEADPLAIAAEFARAYALSDPECGADARCLAAKLVAGARRDCEAHVIVDKLAASDRRGAAPPRLTLVHVPRTGGQWLEEAAARAGVAWGPNAARAADGDATRRRFCRACGPSRHWCSPWHDPSVAPPRPTTTFCVWRDPRERAVSAYRHHALVGPARCTAEALNAFVAREMALGAEDGRHDCHLLPQAAFSCDVRLPFRGLAEAFERLARARGMADVADALRTTPRENNASECELGVDALSSASLSLINATYAEDWQLEVQSIFSEAERTTVETDSIGETSRSEGVT